MRQVTIGGKTLRLECNFLALSAYERITGTNAFDFDYLNTNKMTSTITMGYAMLLANNDPDELGDINAFMASLKDMGEVQQFMLAVSEEAVRFFKPAKGDAAKTADDKGKGRKPKNA